MENIMYEAPDREDANRSVVDLDTIRTWEAKYSRRGRKKSA